MCLDALATSQGEVMPRYTFKLIDDGGGIEDGFGVSLASTAIAYSFCTARPDS